jgi:hypothetical protein
MKDVKFWDLKKPKTTVIKSHMHVTKKDMNWMQAKAKYKKLKPFTDNDHDGLMNMYDCKPFNKKKQDYLSTGPSGISPKLVASQLESNQKQLSQQLSQQQQSFANIQSGGRPGIGTVFNPQKE